MASAPPMIPATTETSRVFEDATTAIWLFNLGDKRESNHTIFIVDIRGNFQHLVKRRALPAKLIWTAISQSF
jgi:hypothetical protein